MRYVFGVNVSPAIRVAAAGAIAAAAVASYAQYNTSTPTFPGSGVMLETGLADSATYASLGHTIADASFFGFGDTAYTALQVGNTYAQDGIAFVADVDGSAIPTFFSGSVDFTFEGFAASGADPLDGTYTFDLSGLDVVSSDGLLKLTSVGDTLGTSTVDPNMSGSGGAFTVNSYFDVFTELSVSNGSGGWGSPGEASRALDFSDSVIPPSSTPEPFTVGLGIAGVGVFLRRRLGARG